MIRKLVPAALPASLLLAAVPAAAQEAPPVTQEAPPAAQEAAAPAEPATPAIDISAKAGKGITFATPDGLYSLNIKGRFQVLETINEEEIADGERELTTEALIRRARLTLAGNAFSPDIEYQLQLGFAPRDLESNTRSPVLDAYIGLTHLEALSLRAGQFKVPFDRANLTSSGSLQFVDRAPMVGELTLDRDVGVMLYSENIGDLFAYSAGIFSGEGRGRNTAPGGFLYVARAEVMPFGPFDAYVEGDLKRLPEPRLAIGASFAYNHNSIRTNSNAGSLLEEDATFDWSQLEADAIFKWSGLSLEGEVMYRDAADETADVEVDGEDVVIDARSALGWFVQGGYMVGPNWEVVARYNQLSPVDDDETENVSDDLNEDIAAEGRAATVGVNWYVHAHALKLQADFTRFWGANTESDFTSVDFGDGANQIRVQAQLQF